MDPTVVESRLETEDKDNVRLFMQHDIRIRFNELWFFQIQEFFHGFYYLKVGQINISYPGKKEIPQ